MTILLCWFALASSRLAAQEPDPGASEQRYDGALNRALSAHASGDYLTAETAIREAHALAPNARTLRGLGVILYAQGRYLEAVEPLEAARTHEVKPLSPELLASVDELLGRIWQRIGRLALQIEPAQSQLSVDGGPPVAHGEREILLSAGDHRVRITALGREPYELALRTQPGSHDSLHVVLAPALSVDPQPAPPAAAALAGAATTRADRRWSPLLRNSLFATSAAVAAAGLATWLTGYLRFVDLKEECEKGCGDRDEQRRRFDDERIGPLTTTGVVLMATGAGALLVIGGIDLWQRRVARTQAGGARTHLDLMPAGGRLRHQF